MMVTQRMPRLLEPVCALEAWLAMEMLREGRFSPTHNLEDLDPECAAIDYVRDGARAIDARTVMNNNFAFGGINTSMIIERYED